MNITRKPTSETDDASAPKLPMNRLISPLYIKGVPQLMSHHSKVCSKKTARLCKSSDLFTCDCAMHCASPILPGRARHALQHVEHQVVQHLRAEQPGTTRLDRSDTLGKSALDCPGAILVIFSWTITHGFSIGDRSGLFSATHPLPRIPGSATCAIAAFCGLDVSGCSSAESDPQHVRQNLATIRHLSFSRCVIADVTVLPMISST